LESVGLLVNCRVPRDVIEHRVHDVGREQEINAALADPKMKARLAELGGTAPCGLACRPRQARRRRNGKMGQGDPGRATSNRHDTADNPYVWNREQRALCRIWVKTGKARGEQCCPDCPRKANSGAPQINRRLDPLRIGGVMRLGVDLAGRDGGENLAAGRQHLAVLSGRRVPQLRAHDRLGALVVDGVDRDDENRARRLPLIIAFAGFCPSLFPAPARRSVCPSSEFLA
jgi:hypothetical protein